MGPEQSRGATSLGGQKRLCRRHQESRTHEPTQAVISFLEKQNSIGS